MDVKTKRITDPQGLILEPPTIVLVSEAQCKSSLSLHIMFDVPMICAIIQYASSL